MWERTLQDLVRGLRANKKDEAKFIATVVDEIRREIKSDDMELKAGAVLKLTYLDMLGYDMSWASFHVVEVMSSPKIHLKSVGYLAAQQSFSKDTDVLMLTTNLLKKDLASSPPEIAVTLNGLSHIVTPDLSRDISPELIPMLNHSRPHIRKRAVLALYNMVVQYPQVIDHARQRLEEKLQDPDPSVVASTVSVLCELARRNPTDYLSLAPQLFHLMTSSTNNWMLIKIIKLFGSLSPHEPRLVKKLQTPITELISTTPAISLLYECVHTCIIGGMLQGPSGDSLARLCVSKLAAFVQDPDQNLKYIALQAMAKIVPSHPHLVTDYQDTILASVNDQDISIRMRALDLVSAMVNRSNFQSIVQQLISHLVREPSGPTATQSLLQNASSPTGDAQPQLTLPSQSPSYRLTLSQRILSMGSQNTYENVVNFEWYLSVLVDLVHVANVDMGGEIRDQLVDIAGRVRAARPYAVKLMYSILTDDTILRNAGEKGSCPEILWAATWICGEYCQLLSDPQNLLPKLLQPEVDNLDPNTISTYIQAVVKIFGTWTAELAQSWDDDMLAEVKQVVASVHDRLRTLAASHHLEVQERAANALQLFAFVAADLDSYRPTPSTSDPSTQLAGPTFPKSMYLIQPLFDTYDLNPVATHAQASVAIPEGLDLDAWIVPPPPEPQAATQSGTEKPKKSKKGKGKEVELNATGKKRKERRNQDQDLVVLTPTEPETPEDQEQREKRKAERLAQMRDDPYYIMDDQSKKTADNDVDSIPVVHLSDMPPIPHESRLASLRTTSQTFTAQSFIIEREGEMPEGASAVPQTHLSSTPSHVSATSRSSTPPVRPLASLGFQPYEGADDPSRSETPPAIKVVRTKKKKAGTKKKTVPES